MRKLLALLAAILLTGPGVMRVGAAEVTVDLFYRGLEPHGDWIETSDYGYVWHPRAVAQDWRPYTAGSWAYTDAGWTWVSEEPFGWATYHYGRWVRVEPVGWVWVPDTEWGPAWVSWRRSPKYVGWAPLPPEARFRKTVGIKEWADTYYDIGPEYYSFVETRHFGAPRLVRVVLPPRENVTVIRETRNITNITVVNNYVHNGGPEYDVIVRESAEPVRRLRLERRTDIAFEPGSFREETIRTQVTGDTLRIAAPEVRFVPTVAPARVARRVEHVQVDRGWNVPGADRRQVEQLRAEVRKEAPQPPADLPRQPKYERLAERTPAEAPADRAQPGQTAGTAAAESRPGKPGATPREQAGTPAGATPPGATVGTPGAEERTPAGRQGRRERAGEGRTPGATSAEGTPLAGTPATTEPGATPSKAPRATPDTTATTPSADEKAAGRGKGRDQKKARTDREQPATPGAGTPAATPGATAPADVTSGPDASTAPSATDEASGRGKGADRGKKKGRTDREQPTAATPGTTPEAATAAPATAIPATSEEGAGKVKGADRDRKKGRSEREQSSEAATPGGAPADAQKRKDRGPRGEESSATTRPEASDRSPATAPGERSATSTERRGPAEAGSRTARPERPERPDRPDASNAAPSRPERPDRPERGGRPEAAAPDRGDAGSRAAERPSQQPRAGGQGASGGERPGRGERPEARERSGGGATGDARRERGEGRRGGAGAPGGAPEAAGAPGQ